MPLMMAACVVVGILFGTFFANHFSSNRLNIINSGSSRLNNLLNIVNDQYVDAVNMDSLMERAIPQILADLDPHSVYISAKDVQTATDDLKGSFSGVGIEFVIRATGRWIKSRRTCELGICFLTGLMNLFTANNTIAIITSGQLAKELGHRYGVDPKRIASLLDTTSCIVQGLIPYGAQILIATGLSTAVQLSAFDIVRGSFYPYLMAAGVMVSVMRNEREKAGEA